MKKGVLGIFDFETDYASNLMEYLNQKEHFYYEICLFTNIERLQEYLQENNLNILLICEEAWEKIKAITKIPTVLILSEDDNIKEEDNSYIFKFQSAERIYTSIMACLNQGCLEGSLIHQKDSFVTFIAVTSPNGGSGKTTFSLALSQEMSKTKKTLYLSFEAIGSCLSEESNKGNMSDLIYYIKQRQKALLMKLQTMVESIEGVDCICAVTHFEDLQTLEKEDIDFLMEEFLKTQVYQSVIFDLGSINRMTLYILEKCSFIYLTYLNKEGARGKEAAFKKIFSLEEKEFLMDRMISMLLPWDAKIAQNKNLGENLIEGELGGFVHKLLYESIE